MSWCPDFEFRGDTGSQNGRDERAARCALPHCGAPATCQPLKTSLSIHLATPRFKRGVLARWPGHCPPGTRNSPFQPLKIGVCVSVVCVMTLAFFGGRAATTTGATTTVRRPRCCHFVRRFFSFSRFLQTDSISWVFSVHALAVAHFVANSTVSEAICSGAPQQRLVPFLALRLPHCQILPSLALPPPPCQMSMSWVRCHGTK